MQIESPITIARALDLIEEGTYVLPAIQREFVWGTEQITRLFDSMMRDYPIGTFLLWEVRPENVKQYGFYQFVQDFDVRTPHNVQAKVAKGKSVVAVLDGQQRLTALNLALRGSYTEKLPRRRWKDPTAFPPRRLHLHLTDVTEGAGAEQTMFRFEFLTAEEVASLDDRERWFPAADALGVDPASLEFLKILQSRDLASDEVAASTLHRLIHLINHDLLVNYYLERSDNLDKVLNIFIRVNSGGTVLSYSDLLLSVATSLWKGDAREEVFELTDQLNEVGGGFGFGKDRVLKAALVLADLPDIKFKVDNFTAKNVGKIEAQWPEISSALLSAAQILARLGLTKESLTAGNVLIPIAYFAKVQGLDVSAVVKPAFSGDLELIRSWVIRSLLRAGFWTGAVDTVLLRSRDVISKSKAPGFPLAELERSLAGAGKSLDFTEDEIEDLIYTAYGQRTVFLLLTLLYPGVNVSNIWHVDHVFPQARFDKRRLVDAGVDAGDVDSWRSWSNLLPNLQLLEGAHNQAKSDMLPEEWVESLPKNQRSHYATFHDLAPLPSDILGFPDWWDARADAMRERLAKVLAT